MVDGVEADLVKANPPDKRLGHGPSAGAVERLDRAPGRCQARNLRLEDEVPRTADRDKYAGPRLRDERVERADVLLAVGPGLAEDPELAPRAHERHHGRGVEADGVVVNRRDAVAEALMAARDAVL